MSSDRQLTTSGSTQLLPIDEVGDGPLPKRIRLTGNDSAKENVVPTPDKNSVTSGLFNKKNDSASKCGAFIPTAILNAFVRAIDTQALAIVVYNKNQHIGMLHELLNTLKPKVWGDNIYFVPNCMLDNTAEQYLRNPLNHAVELRIYLLQAQAECLQNCNTIIPQFNNINIPHDLLRTIDGGFIVWHGRSDGRNNFKEVKPETFSNTALSMQLKGFSEVLQKNGLPEVHQQDVFCISWSESAKARQENTIDLKDSATFNLDPVLSKSDDYCRNVIGLLFTVSIVSRPGVVLSFVELKIAQAIWAEALGRAWCRFQVGDREKNAFDPMRNPIASQVSVISSKDYNIRFQNTADIQSIKIIPRPTILLSSASSASTTNPNTHSEALKSAKQGIKRNRANRDSDLKKDECAAKQGAFIPTTILNAFVRAIDTQALGIVVIHNKSTHINTLHRLLITLKAIKSGDDIYFVPNNMLENTAEEYLLNPLNHAAELRTYLLQAQAECLENCDAIISQFNNINIPNDILRTKDGGYIVWHGRSDVRNNYKDVKPETFSNTALRKQLKNFSAALKSKGFPEVRTQDVYYISWSESAKARKESTINLKDPATFSFDPLPTGGVSYCTNVIGLLFTVYIVSRPGIVLSFEQLKYAQTLWSKAFAEAWCIFQVGDRDRAAFDAMRDPIASQVSVVSSKDYIRLQKAKYAQPINTTASPTISSSSSSTATTRRMLMAQPMTTYSASAVNNDLITRTTAPLSTHPLPSANDIQSMVAVAAATATNFQPSSRM